MGVLICVLFAVCAEGSPEVPPHVVAYLARSDEAKAKHLALLGQSLDLMLRNKSGAAAREIRKKITALRNDPAPFLDRMPTSKPAVGHVGRLREGRFRVVQVVDKTNLIAENYWTSSRVVIPGNPYSGGRTIPHKITIWIRGVSTENLADSTWCEDDRVFHVSGTKTYDTAAGATRTLFVVEPIDLTPFLPATKGRAYRPDKTAAPAALRTWHAATGDFTVEAMFVKVSAGQVTLRKADGSEITLPMDRLCEEDQEWIKKPHARE